MTDNQATKFDQQKPRLDLLSFPALEEIANVMAFGAQKYGEHNWRKGMKWSRLIAGALRHLFTWASGEDKDPESGLSHLAHLGCCVMFLLEYERFQMGEDDRYTQVWGDGVYPKSPLKAAARIHIDEAEAKLQALYGETKSLGRVDTSKFDEYRKAHNNYGDPLG